MDVFQSIVMLFAIFQASLQLDNYNWTESVSAYIKNYKFMSITELFLCDINSNVQRVVKSLNARGIYCNVNLIEMAPNNHNNKKIAKTLSSINFEHHTIMLVDTGCDFARTLLKLVKVKFCSNFFTLLSTFHRHQRWKCLITIINGSSLSMNISIIMVTK